VKLPGFFGLDMLSDFRSDVEKDYFGEAQNDVSVNINTQDFFQENRFEIVNEKNSTRTTPTATTRSRSRARLVLESQLPHKSVNFWFTSLIKILS
jgi:hypothetical protein